MRFAVMGSAHGHIFAFVDDLLAMGGEFVGVHDDQSEFVQTLAEKYDVPVYSERRELFQQGLDVVGTSSINHLKIDVIEECDQHGVHVIADKPLVVSQEQYQRLEQVVQRGQIQVGLMLTVRFMPEIYTMKKLIDEGAIGKLLSVEMFSPHRLKAASRPEWHFSKEENGGIVVDLMIHSVDLFQWLAGSSVEEVTGQVQKSILPEKEDFYDNAQFFLSAANGVGGYLRVDWHITDTHWSWGDMRVFCTGSKGMLEVRALGDPITQEPSIVLFEEGKETRKVQVEPCEFSVTKDFIQRIQHKEHLIGHKDILEATRLTLLMDEKAKKVQLID